MVEKFTSVGLRRYSLVLLLSWSSTVLLAQAPDSKAALERTFQRYTTAVEQRDFAALAAQTHRGLYRYYDGEAAYAAALRKDQNQVGVEMVYQSVRALPTSEKYVDEGITYYVVGYEAEVLFRPFERPASAADQARLEQVYEAVERKYGAERVAWEPDRQAFRSVGTQYFYASFDPKEGRWYFLLKADRYNAMDTRVIPAFVRVHFRD